MSAQGRSPAVFLLEEESKHLEELQLLTWAVLPVCGLLGCCILGLAAWAAGVGGTVAALGGNLRPSALLLASLRQKRDC